MTLTMIFGLTGLSQEPASSGPDELSARLNHPGDDSLTVKTHYPRLGIFPPPTIFDPYEFMDRAILVLRHPMNCLPSYHNQRYEITTGIPSHTTRATVPEWIAWRDSNFDYEMARWVEHTTFWLDRYSEPGPYGNVFLSIYEGITDDVEGPGHAQALAEFLDAGENVHALTDEHDVKCSWYKILKDKSSGTHRAGPKYRPYTPSQLDTMSKSLMWLRDRYEDQPIGAKIVPVLNTYLDMVEEKRYEERPEPATLAIGRKRKVQYRAGTN